jgi:transcriptional regulator with XRE-family HTH domain
LAECLGVDVSELTEEPTVFYDKFVELCAKKQISPCAAAEEMGYQRSVVTRWSKGTAPRDATIQRVANYFGVSASFLKGEEQKENPAVISDNEVDEVTMELLEIINNGSDADRQDMLDMLRIFNKRREKG